MEGILRNGPVLSVEQQLCLLKPVSAKEVKSAILKIDSNRSPGPDGYGSGFFKAAWDIVGTSVTEAVLEFFQTGELLQQLNATNIALIPKVEAPEFASQYMPISCFNVIYKCISKILCNKLSKAIEIIVADNQAAFVQGRSMIHNILICHDLMRHYNKKTSPRCLMKIDLKKAYDMVSWEFVEEALNGYGFPQKFTQLIMACVSSTKFTVKVNGGGYGYFPERRGLRQGDSLSPLLVVLVMEYLSRVLKCMRNLPDFKFHPMCKNLKLTHLIFADDLMIFCKGKKESMVRVMEALTHFSEVTGLVANMEKSTIFIAGVDDQTKEQLLTQTGFELGSLPIKYLGLPLSLKKWNRMDCHQLTENMIRKIKNSYAKKLSYAGRLQVVNAVLFSIFNF